MWAMYKYIMASNTFRMMFRIDTTFPTDINLTELAVRHHNDFLCDLFEQIDREGNSDW